MQQLQAALGRGAPWGMEESSGELGWWGRRDGPGGTGGSGGGECVRAAGLVKKRGVGSGGAPWASHSTGSVRGEMLPLEGAHRGLVGGRAPWASDETGYDVSARGVGGGWEGRESGETWEEARRGSRRSEWHALARDYADALSHQGAQQHQHWGHGGSLHNLSSSVGRDSSRYGGGTSGVGSPRGAPWGEIAQTDTLNLGRRL